MPLPNREYYYLPEVVEKLGITEFDLQYYMSQGFLLGCVFIDAVMQREDPDRPGFLKPSCPCEGPVYLDPKSCRALFTSGKLQEKLFYFTYPNERVVVPECGAPIQMRLADLFIRSPDLYTFIKQYGVNDPDARPAKAGGRPSLRKLVMAEHSRRVKTNEARKTKSHEALALRAWSQVHLKEGIPPSTNTIRGWLSENRAYKSYVLSSNSYPEHAPLCRI